MYGPLNVKYLMFLTSMVLVHLLTILQATSLLPFIDQNPLLSITADGYAVSVEQRVNTTAFTWPVTLPPAISFN